MHKVSVQFASVIACCVALCSASAPAAENGSPVPPLESLASEWLDVTQITQMPSLHNFHEMACCAPSLLGVNYFPGRRLFVYPVTTRWYEYYSLPLVKLKVNGQVRTSTSCRWYPYQGVRRTSVDGLEIETTVRLMFESPGILYRVQVRNPGNQPRLVQLTLEVPGEQVTPSGSMTLHYRSAEPPLEVAHCFVQQPTSVVQLEGAVAADWQENLEPGESTELELVMAHSLEDDPSTAEETIEQAQAWASRFDHSWNAIQTGWEKRWAEAFTPGNGHFSGCAPTLDTSDDRLSDIYYRSIMTLLVLHRTNLKMCDRVFVTSGERHKGNVFYWDTSMWSKVFALLEPEGMKQQLRLFLQLDPHGGFVYDMHRGEQGDGWYAANDMTMFRLVYGYLSVTGDEAFLEETVGDRTVLEHLDKLATGWQALQRDPNVMLADYGENENLLECAPLYVHRVPSFNSANVWMMRIVADLYHQQGNVTRAAQLRRWADEIAAAVLQLYKPGDGVWHALHRDGNRVELRHCYDFVCVGSFMSNDLSEQIKQEMVAFVQRELLTDKWMRAMSPQDQAAAISDRPDHGPLGAFDAWPALTADTMCELGAWKEAIDFVRSTQAVLYEGVYSQAREFYGPKRLQHDAPVRIALRGACMRECVGGGAFAEMIVGAAFGFRPDFGHSLTLRQPEIKRHFDGKLTNVHYQGKRLEITSDATGVSYREQP